MSTYRQGKFIQAYLHKQQFDDYFESFDKNQWYTVSTDRISSAELRECFVQSSFNSATNEFLQNSREVSDSVFLQIFYSVASAFFQLFTTKTTSNGLLNRGSMFLFSPDQLANFMGISQDIRERTHNKTVIDLGAGDGHITKNFEKFYSNIFATETSSAMVWRLQQKGYTVLDVNSWSDHLEKCDLISALNVLDRIPEPIDFLHSLNSASKKFKCPIILAVVFPWSQYCEFSHTNSTVPLQKINISGENLEQQIEYFSREVLLKNDFKVLRWTRLPYLCEGDAYQSFYVLSDIVFLIEPVDFE